MSIHAVDKTFIEFLNPQENIVFTIPTYQREYSWRSSHCEELLNDIRDNDKGYFVGSIIWIENTHEIIDGQQRLTSLNLLLLSIYCRFCEFETTDDLIYKKSCLKRMIVYNDKNRLVLQKQGKNKDDFEYLINDKLLKLPGFSMPKNYGNRRISSNFKFFVEAIKTYTLEQLNDLFDKICGLKFISAMVDDVQLAFTLFETMNNRGMDLSAIDLIKSSYMSYTNDIENWETLISILGNESNQEQFLRNNYNAFRKEYNNIEGLVSTDTRYEIANKATRSNVIKIYNTLIKQHGFMRFTTDNAKYNSLLTGEDNPQIETNDEYINYFIKFRNSNATSSFMLLLFLLRNEKPYDMDVNEMCSIFELILRFFIRRNLTNTPSTGALPQILMNIIASINGLPKPAYSDVYKTIKESLISQSASNERLEEVLRGDIYDANRDMTRYLLCSLCAFKENKEKEFVGLWKKENDKYIWTIEHILPEGNKDASNTPPYWIKMIRDGNSEYKDLNDRQICDLIKQYRHKIGNLTMTGYNSSLSNRPFADKKEIGYNNGLSLNDYVYQQNEWHISNIVERTNVLVNILMQDLNLDI